MRKFFNGTVSVITALLIMANGLFSFRVNAVEIESGRCGEDLVWSFSEGTLTISGTGDMTNYSGSLADKAPWWGRDIVIKNVVIDYGVTSIGDYAFEENVILNPTIKSVIIPDSVKRIGKSAFEDCNKLEEITIPESVTTIDDSAFLRCTGLISVTIPDSVTYLGRGAFAYCMSLKSVSISDNIKSIDNSVFYRCSGLESVIIPDGVETIGPGAFDYCHKLSSVTIPDSVKTIETEAFYFCKSLHLESIIVPESVTAIDELAFAECKHTVVYYPSTASLGDCCFYRTKAAVKYEVRDGKAYITEITGDPSDIVFPEKISGYDVVYEDISSGAGAYGPCEMI